ncbi:hypothetical protein [Cellulomonas oligotrophica]|uniref:Uncharacterized protein n=1 Tax=Cellulomonas oligotrophica TaxID=931536 RepID=A0A7Y9FGX9_9CELL|nr:hypothetical protein [Cellulomonas oligotrophica]NYD87045.1 hypothetical protein [Cellulomonas oligotrophica]GIG32169.1 hypothetical protein Col01nite_13280 [Cellulomonas oligotrophica]
MKIVPVQHGALVTAEGTVLHDAGRFVLIPEAHWTPELVSIAPLPPDLGFVVPIVSGDIGGAVGSRITVTGAWTGSAIDVHRTTPVPTTPAPAQTFAPAALVPRPAGMPGPPGDLERALLDDGTITDRCGYHDGTLHVVADDVDLATRLLTPLHGDRLRVERAVFSQSARQAATTAMRAAVPLDVVCAWGSEPHDDARPTETVHSLEAGWITEELATTLAPVPDGLIRVRTHVTSAS